MSHTCKALVISCIDFRFQKLIQEFLTANGYQDDHDLITYPGASLAWEQIKDAVAISFRLHQPAEVILIDHEDCGAYGEDNKLETHVTNLEKAAQAISEVNQEMKVKKLMAYFDSIQEV